jgi:hypothetical protein
MAALGAREHVVDGAQVEEPQDLGLVQRARDETRRRDVGKVEHGPCHAGDGDAVTDRDVHGIQPHAVRPDRPGRPSATRAADVDEGRAAAEQPPVARGRPVAEHRVRAASEDGGHVPARSRQQRMPDGEHGAMNPVQPADAQAVRDRVVADPQRRELPAGDHRVLHPREGREGGVAGG